jgi:integrase/transposase
MGTFTTAFVRDAKPRASMYELTCDALPGFILRVLPTGKKVFLVRYRVDGKDHRERIGLWGPSLSVDDARRRAALMLSNAAVGEPIDDDPGPRAAVKLAQSERASSQTAVRALAERFIREYVDVYLKPGTAENYRTLLADTILPWRPTIDGRIDETQRRFGDRDFRSVTRAEVQAIHASMKATPGKANYVVCVIGSLYTRIIEDWELSNMRNPASRVRRFRGRKVERFLSPEERQRVHAVMQAGLRIPAGRPGHLEPASVWALNLLGLTGLRRDEIRDLCWHSIDWQHVCLKLVDSKTGPRNVPVSAEVMTLLKEIHDRTGNPKQGRVVRSRTGGKLTGLNRTWEQIRAAAGISDVRLHDLRHSFASDALGSGVPLAVVGEMLGHRQPSTTQRYAHLADKIVRQALVVTTRSITESIHTIPALAESPFEPVRDAQWSRIQPLVERTRGAGGVASDLRKIVDAIRWVLQRGVRWRDLPAQYGRPTTCWRWYERWCGDGTWDQIAAVLGNNASPPAAAETTRLPARRRSTPRTRK